MFDTSDKTIEKDLRRRWDSLTSFVSTSVKEKWWDKIYKNYSKRSFYNLHQLEFQLRLFDKYKDNLKDSYATAFAIFFKHLNYGSVEEENTTAVNLNDEVDQNIKCLHEFSSETTFDQVNYVSDLLIKSAHNCTDAHLKPNEFGSEDVHYLIDFDTAWLGVEPELYNLFISLNRHEFKNCSDEDYRAYRLKILEFFLQIPNIFATRELREKYEAQARINLQKEIYFLKN